MFEKYIDKYFLLVNQEFQGEDPVELNKVFTNDILPTPIKKYFESEVESSLGFTKGYIQNSRIFSLTESDVEKSLSKLESSLRETMRIDSISFEEFLRNSIEIRFNYILRPKFTISSLAFNESDEIETEYLKSIFNKFIEYKYLKEGFLTYLEENPSILISKNDFDKAIKKIDNSYIYELNSKDFSKITDSCFNLFTFDSIKPELDSIPIEALMIFFDEKGVTPILEKLQELANNQDLEFINHYQFQNLISELDSENSNSDLAINLDESENESYESNSENNSSYENQEENNESSDLSLEEDLASLSDDIETVIDSDSSKLDLNQNPETDNANFDLSSELNEFDDRVDMSSSLEDTEEHTPETILNSETNKNKNSEDSKSNTKENLDYDISEIDEIFDGEDSEIKYKDIEKSNNDFQSEIENIYKDI